MTSLFIPYAGAFYELVLEGTIVVEIIFYLNGRGQVGKVVSFDDIPLQAQEKIIKKLKQYATSP